MSRLYNIPSPILSLFAPFINTWHVFRLWATGCSELQLRLQRTSSSSSSSSSFPFKSEEFATNSVDARLPEWLVRSCTSATIHKTKRDPKSKRPVSFGILHTYVDIDLQKMSAYLPMLKELRLCGVPASFQLPTTVTSLDIGYDRIDDDGWNEMLPLLKSVEHLRIILRYKRGEPLSIVQWPPLMTSLDVTNLGELCHLPSRLTNLRIRDQYMDWQTMSGDKIPPTPIRLSDFACCLPCTTPPPSSSSSSLNNVILPQPASLTSLRLDTWWSLTLDVTPPPPLTYLSAILDTDDGITVNKERPLEKSSEDRLIKVYSKLPSSTLRSINFHVYEGGFAGALHTAKDEHMLGFMMWASKTLSEHGLFTLAMDLMDGLKSHVSKRALFQVLERVDDEELGVRRISNMFHDELYWLNKHVHMFQLKTMSEIRRLLMVYWRYDAKERTRDDRDPSYIANSQDRPLRTTVLDDVLVEFGMPSELSLRRGDKYYFDPSTCLFQQPASFFGLEKLSFDAGRESIEMLFRCTFPSLKFIKIGSYDDEHFDVEKLVDHVLFGCQSPENNGERVINMSSRFPSLEEVCIHVKDKPVLEAIESKRHAELSLVIKLERAGFKVRFVDKGIHEDWMFATRRIAWPLKK